MKLNYKRTFFVGLAFMSICAFWQVYDGIVPLILKNTFHMGDTWAGAIMALDNVLALFLLPIFGSLSDRVHMPLGRRMPFIVFGTVAASALMLLLPIANSARNLPLFIAALALVLLAMGTYRSPVVALMPDVTPKPLRSKANAVINLMGAVGGIYALGMIKFLAPKGEDPNYMPLFISIAVIMLVAVAVLLLTIRERRMAAEADVSSGEAAQESPAPAQAASAEKVRMAPDVKRSFILILVSIFLWFTGYNAITTAFSKYANVYWGMSGGDFASPLMIGTIGAIIAYIPVAAVATKLGRRKTILIGIAIIFAAFLTGSFLKIYSIFVTILFALVGLGWAAINVNSYPMVVEMATGSDTGKYTGYYYTFSMAAQILTPIVSGALLENVGYWTLFPYGAFFLALSFVTMLFVRHGDSKPLAPKSKLEVFDSND